MTAPLATTQQIINGVTATNGNLMTQTFTYTNIGSVSGITNIKTGSGVLGRIVLTKVLTSGISAWDNTVSGGNVLFGLPPAAAAGVFGPLDVDFSTGLTISCGSVLDSIVVIYN